MKLQVQPNNWSCFPTAFAIAFDIPVEKIILEIGHDGSEIIWPDEKEPMNRRAFHEQEIFDVGYRLGFAITPFTLNPTTAGVPNYGYLSKLDAFDRIDKLLKTTIGVITGWHNPLSMRETEDDWSSMAKLHAVAWDMKLIFDPRGFRYQITDFVINNFYAIKSISRDVKLNVKFL